MGSRYVSEVLLANVKKIIKNSETTEAREKNKHIFGMLRILEFFMYNNARTGPSSVVFLRV